MLLWGRGLVNGHSAWSSPLRCTFAAQSIPKFSNSSWPIAFCMLLPIERYILLFFTEHLIKERNEFNGLLSQGTAPQDYITSLRMPGNGKHVCFDGTDSFYY